MKPFLPAFFGVGVPLLYAGLDEDDPRVQAAKRWIAANYTLDVKSTGKIVAAAFSPPPADQPEASPVLLAVTTTPAPSLAATELHS